MTLAPSPSSYDELLAYVQNNGITFSEDVDRNQRILNWLHDNQRRSNLTADQAIEIAESMRHRDDGWGEFIPRNIVCPGGGWVTREEAAELAKPTPGMIKNDEKYQKDVEFLNKLDVAKPVKRGEPYHATDAQLRMFRVMQKRQYYGKPVIKVVQDCTDKHLLSEVMDQINEPNPPNWAKLAKKIADMGCLLKPNQEEF